MKNVLRDHQWFILKCWLPLLAQKRNVLNQMIEKGLKCLIFVEVDNEDSLRKYLLINLESIFSFSEHSSYTSTNFE